MTKGWLAVFLAQTYGPDYGFEEGFVGFVALAVFFGHLYPVFLKFKGGKGVATAAGVLLAIDPRLGLAILRQLAVDCHPAALLFVGGTGFSSGGTAFRFFFSGAAMSGCWPSGSLPWP
jgi:hypothetical protein